MTEEEKEAIKTLDNDNWEYLEFMDEDEEYEKLKKSIEAIVKLAKKQVKENKGLQKEIKEWKRETKIVWKCYEEVCRENDKLNKCLILDDTIPKEKIREKIQKLENGEQCYYEFSTGDLVDLLKELLEEG